MKTVKEGKTLTSHRGKPERGGRMEDIMTDKQFKTILEMVDMILDGCKDLDEAKEKIKKLVENQKNKPTE